ncbi:MAG TPA: hypothetical protein VGI10_01535 [Polyangiaceae bacterium]|jgi:hypothetical protein
MSATLALVFVVLVSGAEVNDQSTTALTQAAREVLGANAAIEVRTYAEPQDDSELVRSAPVEGAIAEVVWQDPQHRHAWLRCYVSSEGRLIAREIAFEPDDAPRERGRMLGFALASLVPRTVSANSASGQHTPQEIAQPAPVLTEPPTRVEVPVVAPLAPPTAHRYYAAIDVVAAGATGLAGGLGAGIDGRWFFHPALGLRLGFAVRRSEIESARVFSDLKYAALGLGFRFAGDDASRFTLGGRADFLLLAHEVGRFPAQSVATERRTSLMAGADLLLEGTLSLSTNAALIGAAGLEVPFADDLELADDQTIAELPPLRAIAELGIRARF